MTRRQLVDLAWKPDRNVDLRSVDVHIHWLRAKIEPEPGRPTHLVTIRGYGYRLDPERVNHSLTAGETSVDARHRQWR